MVGPSLTTASARLFRSSPRAWAATAGRPCAEAVDLPVRVRMGMHTGQAQQRADGYVGLDVHRAARIADAAHGGQVVLSQAVLSSVRSGGKSATRSGMT